MSNKVEESACLLGGVGLPACTAERSPAAASCARLRRPEARATDFNGAVRWSLILWVIAMPLAAQTDPARQLEAAIHREIVSGDVTGAVAAYRALASDDRAPRGVTARALLQLGQCQ